MTKKDMIVIIPGGSWRAQSLNQLQPVVIPLTFAAVRIHNETKTCQVYVGVNNGELTIIVDNEQQDSIFKFEER
jgi:hypothetical protein